ncbi:MAG TPA: glutaminase, partial [Thermomicrobiales bacterium]|nr:glutaminase [Thermomicrobiales bacterium]
MLQESDVAPFVSTGHLPAPEAIQQALIAAHTRFGPNRDGEPSAVYPALATVAPDQFGLCVVSATGQITAVGDTETPFTIMSVSKPFVFALVCQAIGPDAALDQIGAD